MHSARLLRARQTPAEAAFWELVRAKRLGGYKFRRQHEVADLFIADFFCAEAALVVELDGGVHDGSAAESADAERTRIIEAYGKGAHVLRIRNERVLTEPDDVAAEVLALVESLTRPAQPDSKISKLPLPTASLRAPVGRGSGGEVVDDDAPGNDPSIPSDDELLLAALSRSVGRE